MKSEQVPVFRARLKQLMDTRKITAYRISKELPCSQTSVTNWLSKKVPTNATLVRLAQYFDVPIAYLVGDTDDPNDRSKTHWGEIIELHKKRPGTSITDAEYDEIVDAFMSASPELRAAALAVLKSGAHTP